jgi:hypothetical protein
MTYVASVLCIMSHTDPKLARMICAAARASEDWLCYEE